MKTKLLIVGGGITGLAAAWEAQRLLGADYLLAESEPRLGGKVITHRLPAADGAEFVVDAGPESFVTRKPEVVQLAEEAGLAENLVDPGAESSGMFVLTDGEPLPVPTSAGVFLSTSLLSFGAKARFLAEPFIKPRRDDEDESLDSFVTRRLGRKVSERMMGPILGGIYQADPQRQSIQTTAPVMREMERDHGSLFRAMLARAKAKRAQQEPAKYPAFVSFERGVQPLVDGIAGQLLGTVLTGTAVRRITQTAEGFEAILADGTTVETEGVVLACPASVAAQLLPAAPQAFRKIRYTDIGTATLVYPTGGLGRLAGIRGCMVPKREGRRIDAVMVTSRRMPSRSVAGYDMVRVVFGANDPSLVGLPDDELTAALHAELVDLFGLESQPVRVVATHWPKGYPQADVGHLRLVDQLEAGLPAGVAVAGSAYRGVGVPDCIRQGREAVRRLVADRPTAKEAS